MIAKRLVSIQYFIAAAVAALLFSCEPGTTEPKTGDYLVLVPSKGGQGESPVYKNTGGKTIVPYGRYRRGLNDTIRELGFVMDKEGHYFGINASGKELFEVFPFDNGPDYPSDGLFRIVKNDKIGYADTTGKIVIQPVYSCARPFENGVAEVSLQCTEEKDGEHFTWKSDAWFHIDKKGNKIK
jgi:hypothetical protein